MSNKILMLLIGVVLVLLLGMGGGLFMMWNKLSTLDAKGPSAVNEQPGKAPEAQPLLGPIFPLDTFIVNLADKGGNRYLRITMDLELNDSAMENELEKRLPQVRDSILMILPTKRFEDISSAEGKTALRDEMREKLNSFLAQGQVTNIYFKEFVVQ
ncbi:MAG: flagellar basal body-associated FliL family protein [Desulfobacterales bacterium]